MSPGKKTIRKWKTVLPEEILDKIRPGMSLFVGSAGAEPQTMLQHLLHAPRGRLEDLEVVQLLSFGAAVSSDALEAEHLRLKTFFSGWVADAAVRNGHVDFVPCRFTNIPHLIESGLVSIDVAIVQITPPDNKGFCSLGVAVDVAREAMEQASITVGEIQEGIPVTFGDTFVRAEDFDFLIESSTPPLVFNRWPTDDVYEEIADRVAQIIEDGSCIAFFVGPLFESLGKVLAEKRHLGIHSPFFTDALMDLVNSGAVTNHRKGTHRGKSLTSYAIGTRRLLRWLDRNPRVEFQRIDKIFDPFVIGRNPRFVTVVPAHTVDLYGRISLERGCGDVASCPTEVMDLYYGAELSPGGRTIFALPSRNEIGEANIRLSIEDMPNPYGVYEAVKVVATEYGLAHLEGQTVRERAQALIDIAHPDDRQHLVETARQANILYRDQIFLADSGRLYPKEIRAEIELPDGTRCRFRPIKPSDEEGMRRLFYRFSNEAVYARYFSRVRAMPHKKMQEYVNVDWRQVMSIVGVVGEEDSGRIVAEARYIRIPGTALAELEFIVDEAYQSMSIATFLYRLLIRLARERGVKEFAASVLFSNASMMKVFRKGGLPVKAHLESGIYDLTIQL
ncbi:MAG: GNAT family N-acetyltransferase [Desulfobacteraceae bacterium]|nr:GNAT family N-acetyltransferase [Desulfobacteraceae bacterium]